MNMLILKTKVNMNYLELSWSGLSHPASLIFWRCQSVWTANFFLFSTHFPPNYVCFITFFLLLIHWIQWSSLHFWGKKVLACFDFKNKVIAIMYNAATWMMCLEWIVCGSFFLVKSKRLIVIFGQIRTELRSILLWSICYSVVFYLRPLK